MIFLQAALMFLGTLALIVKPLCRRCGRISRLTKFRCPPLRPVLQCAQPHVTTAVTPQTESFSTL